jgi:hypothetical protein
MLLSESYKNRLQELAGLVNEARMEDLYDKYFSDIPREEFDKIISSVPDISKERNDYKSIRVMSNWLINLYRAGNLKIEDLYKAKEYLTLYYRNSSDLIKQGVDIKLENYKDLPSLYQIIKNYKDSQKPDSKIEDESEIITNKYFLNNKQAEKIFEDSQWLVVSPKTLEASKFYGCTSEWCTLFPDMFNKYSSEGPLYIIIDKTETNEKLNPFRRYQFHFESEQYMDMYDRDIFDEDYYEENNDELPNVLEEFSPKLLNWYLSNKIKTRQGLNSYDLNFISFISEEQIYEAVEKRFKQGKGYNFILELDNNVKTKIIEKLFKENENFLLGKLYDNFVSQEIRDENAERAIKIIDYSHFINIIKQKFDIIKSLNSSFVVRNVSENLLFKYVSSIIEKSKLFLEEKKTYFKTPENYNVSLGTIISNTTDYQTLPNSVKDLIYKNIYKNEYFFLIGSLNENDKKDYFLNLMNSGKKILESDLQKMNKILDKNLINQYVESLLEKIKKEGPNENSRMYPYMLNNMLSPEQQREYVQNMFLVSSANTPIMNYIEWISLDKNLKEDLQNFKIKGDYTILSKELMKRLVIHEKEQSEREYKEHMAHKYS